MNKQEQRFECISRRDERKKKKRKKEKKEKKRGIEEKRKRRGVATVIFTTKITTGSRCTIVGRYIGAATKIVNQTVLEMERPGLITRSPKTE